MPRDDPKMIWSRLWTPMTNLVYGIVTAQNMPANKLKKYMMELVWITEDW